MIRLIAIAAFALALATSAQAMSPPPLHKSDGMSTEARYRGVARGYGGYRHYGYGVRRYGYSGYRHYGYSGYRHYGYRPTAIGPTAMELPVELLAAISAEESADTPTEPSRGGTERRSSSF